VFVFQIQVLSLAAMIGQTCMHIIVLRMDIAGINGKLWATFLPAEAASVEGGKPRGVSLAMRDLQTAAVYDTQGQFVGIRRPGSGKPITVTFPTTQPPGNSFLLPNLSIGCCAIDMRWARL
jgi:hypothetical protein